MGGFWEGGGGPVLAVSPHLDDAVLSAGATLARLAADRPVTVLTLFAGDPGPELSAVAGRHHARCGLDGDAVSARRAEDAGAMAVLGAQPVHGDVPDAVYRRRPGGGWVCEEDGDMFSVPPDDPGLDRRLAELVLGAAEATGATLVLGPVGTGGHVDHVLTRRAVLRAAAARGLPVLCWQDEPYASWSKPDMDGPALRVPFTPETLAAKLGAVACYRSQLGMLWPGGQDWRAAVSRAGAGGPPGEVFCRPHAASSSTR
ncbi:PIG-L deacetylase family protein [Streptomyces aidingensis]|uniref:N-acetylglucosaminyl deacetylase, LmbE family n=1 Tax=Streptomyces aidingensis TaxID=910347 RepID=A0A1I1UHU4_9ACTN|nr:PIG-L family deacetylase [Streptomyces aidingensis]SFD70436.1 N-acetylglucosaminyl deacetylase, LmbE family [Streptomyces aidingensis]